MMAAASKPVLELRHVARSYAEGKGRLDVFLDASLTVRPGEIVALVGPSGAGKSSLLHIAGLLEAPTGGEVFIAGQNCTALDDARAPSIRRFGIGFIYQFHHLLPEFSALENVVMPQLIAGTRSSAARERARELLDRLGLGRAARPTARPNFPAESSSASPLRARSQIVHYCCWRTSRPGISIPAPPNKCTKNSAPHPEEGLGALIATHNFDLARRMSRVVRLENGHLVEGLE